MRKVFQRQRQFGCRAVKNIELNLNCRDEIIPVLAALQHQLRGQILALVPEAAETTRTDSFVMHPVLFLKREHPFIPRKVR